MNNVRLEVEKAETLPFEQIGNSHPSDVFKSNGYYYIYLNVNGIPNLYKTSNIETTDWSLEGRINFTDSTNKFPKKIDETTQIETTVFNQLNTNSSMIGSYAIFNHNDNIYLTAFVENDLAEALKPLTYPAEPLDSGLVIFTINKSNPIDVDYLGYIRMGHGNNIWSSQKTDSIYYLFYNPYKNKIGLTGRKRAAKNGDTVTWYNSNEDDTHSKQNTADTLTEENRMGGFGIYTTDPENPDYYLGPAKGTERATNRRSINIFYSVNNDLISERNDFLFDNVLDPKSPNFYNYTPNFINNTNVQKYPTLKPDFYYAPAQLYDGRILINTSLYVKDDRLADRRDDGSLYVDDEENNTINRREGSILPTILYSRKGSSFKPVHHQDFDGTKNYYETYLGDDLKTDNSEGPLTYRNYNVNAFYGPSYTSGPNPIFPLLIRQTYPNTFFIDGDNIYLSIFHRNYYHNNSGFIGSPPDPHRAKYIKLKKDRFFGWKATNSNAYITTKLMSVDSAINYINVNAKGSFKVQLLNANDSSLGYLTISNNDTFTSDEDEINKYIPLPTRAYNEFKLRFHLLTTNTKLFAFRFYYPNNLTNIPDPDVVVTDILAPTLISPINGQTVSALDTPVIFTQSEGFVVSSGAIGNTYNRYRIDWTTDLVYFSVNDSAIPNGFGQTRYRYSNLINPSTGNMEVPLDLEGYGGANRTIYWRARAEEVVDATGGIVTNGLWSEVQTFILT
jgi:hypothetical protein